MATIVFNPNTATSTLVFDPLNVVIGDVDGTPNSFNLGADGSAPLNAWTYSDSPIITGINTPVAISIVNGEYSINGASFTANAGTVENNDFVQVRFFTGNLHNVVAAAVVTIGGVASTFAVTTELDTSAPVITLSGDNPLNLNVGDTYVEPGFSATDNVDSFISSDVTVVESLDNSQESVGTVTYSVTDSAGNETSVIRTVTFSVEIDTTPDVFSLGVNVSNVDLGEVTDRTVVVSGLNTPTAISVVNGHYRINSAIEGDFTAGSGLVSNGDVVDVRNTASSEYSATISTELNIGGVTSSFLSTVRDADLIPNAITLGSAITETGLNEQFTRSFIVSGIEAEVAIVTSANAVYRINGGNFTSDVGTVNAGDVVDMRFNSSLEYASTVTVTVDVGSISASLDVTTVADITVTPTPTPDPEPVPTPTPEIIVYYADRVVSIFGGSGAVHNGGRAPLVLPEIHPLDDTWLWFSFGEYEPEVQSVSYILPEGWVELSTLADQHVSGRDHLIHTKSYGVQFQPDENADGDYPISISAILDGPPISEQHFSGVVRINPRK